MTEYSSTTWMETWAKSVPSQPSFLCQIYIPLINGHEIASIGLALYVREDYTLQTHQEKSYLLVVNLHG